MVSRRGLVVYVLPVIISVIIGSAVLGGILQEPGRELNMMPGNFSVGTSHETIKIIGLSSQYTTTNPVSIQVKVTDSSFDCGDLYITIYSSGNDVVTQGGFFEQCFDGKNTLPIDDTFSQVIDTPGSYEIVAEMVSKGLQNISTRGVFTVK